jgi:uncharacterized FAD-dependent dehydrogenase
VLTEFVEAGAPAEILYVSKPHIGTFRLVSMIEHMRARSSQLGGEIRFQPRRGGRDRSRTGPCRPARRRRPASSRAMSCWRSATARATPSGCCSSAACISSQAVLDRRPHRTPAVDHRLRPARRKNAGNPLLGAADYKLVHHCRQRPLRLFSFCMCPGGTVVAATSKPGRLVTNGMSQYSRNERNANSAIVVGVTPADYPGSDSDPLAGIAFQRHWEEPGLRSRRLQLATRRRSASAISSRDRPPPTLGSVLPSYTPGVTPSDLNAVPARIRDHRHARSAAGFRPPDRRLLDGRRTDDRGRDPHLESPIRITRGDDFQSLNTRGLFPAGEGAGYAGGILSAAVDGIRVAEAVALSLTGAAQAPEAR